MWGGGGGAAPPLALVFILLLFLFLFGGRWHFPWGAHPPPPPAPPLWLRPLPRSSAPCQRPPTATPPQSAGMHRGLTSDL